MFLLLHQGLELNKLIIPYMMIIKHLTRQIKNYPSMKETFSLEQFSYSTSKKTISSQISKSSTQESNKDKKVMKSKKTLELTDNVTMFNKIMQWREHNQAPVDVMGCQKQADPQAPLEIQKFQTLVSLMLSIQTKDETTHMIMTRLKERGLSPQQIAKYEEQTLRNMIYESNFNKRKACNLIKVSCMILEKGRLARTLDELISYPGVGMKIAMLYLKIAEGKEDQGVGVDVHVHRISNRLGWVNTKTPEETQQQLREVFPVKVWKDINLCMVGFGQLRCNARKPLCQGCPVEASCPSASYKW